MSRLSPRGCNPIRRPWRRWLIVVSALAAASLFLLRSLPPTHDTQDARQRSAENGDPDPKPLDPLSAQAIALARLSLEAVLERQSTTLPQAAARYFLKSGRRPPPNFDKWFEFARLNKCLVDDYGQIQRDFEPFYQLAADNPNHFQDMINRGRAQLLKEIMPLATTKKQEAVGMTAIQIKNGRPEIPPYSGTTYARDLPRNLRKFSPVLPDLEFLLNGRDEPRVVFNYQEPGTQQARALKLEDITPFHVTPYPTAEFFRNQNGCNLFSKADGFIYDESADVPFLRSSSSSDFTTDLWPLLSMTKLSPCFSDILFPGQYYYRASRWSAKMRPNDIPWSDKKPQLYWRGTSNGGHIVGENYRSFPRFRLLDMARQNKELINAKMTRFAEGHCGKECDRVRIIQEYDIFGPFAPRNDALQYKYLLDVDGNTFSGRFLTLLRSGSLVFKSTVFEEYFNDWILPYEHYIPVKPDLSDLLEKIEWALAHEGEARRIQETGKLFTERVMTDAQNDCYFAAVLLEWARLQNYANTSAVVTDSVAR
ncbi:glycosyl transferase family 90-domain-containing protein [Mycena vitilis]|nr:glycosyl transferase family 90-domain-containing protein [Mycena vitilis]